METQNETRNEIDLIEAAKFIMPERGEVYPAYFSIYPLNENGAYRKDVCLLTKYDTTEERWGGHRKDSLVLVWEKEGSLHYRNIITKSRMEPRLESIRPSKTCFRGFEEEIYPLRAFTDEEEKEWFNLGVLTPKSFYGINEFIEDSNEIKILYGTSGNPSLSEFKISKKEMGLEDVLQTQTDKKAPVEGEKPLQLEGRMK